MQQQQRAVSSAPDNGGITIKKSGGSDSEEQSQGNQAMIAELKGQECPCGTGGILTGAYTTEESEAVDSEARWAQDITFDDTWAQWVHYPPEQLAAEKSKVDEYNHLFDDINAQNRSDIDNKYDRVQSTLDVTADNAVDDGSGNVDRSSAAWKSARDGAASSNQALEWKPETKGDPFSGFQGDLEYRGDQAGPQGAAWMETGYDLSQAFPGAFDSEEAEAAGESSVPVRGYMTFADQKGKMSSHPIYGWGAPEPSSVYLSWEIEQVHHWCEDHEGKGKAKEFKGSAPTGGAFGSKRRNHLKGGGPKSKVVGYLECESLQMRNTVSGKVTELKGQAHAEGILGKKEAEAKQWQAYHQGRIDYIEDMEAGPASKD